jgi:hypothetical protein
MPVQLNEIIPIIIGLSIYKISYQVSGSMLYLYV